MRNITTLLFAGLEALTALAQPLGSGDAFQQSTLTEAFAGREYFYVGGEYVDLSVVSMSFTYAAT